MSAPRLFPSILLILTGAAVVSTSAASAASSTGFPVVSSPRIAVSNRTPEELYAVDTATRRRCCTVELDVGGRLTSPLDGSGGNGFAVVGGVLGFASLADGMLLGAGLQVDGTGGWTVLAGVRRVMSLNRLESHLDLQLASDVSPSFGLGARVAAGLSWKLNPDSSMVQWSVGPALGFAAFAIRQRVVVDASVALAAGF